MAEPASTRSQPKPGHETTDVSPRAILISALVLAVVVILVHPLLWWATGYFEGRAERADPQVSPLAGREEPPLPRLRPSPARDLEEFLAAEHKQLSEYDWIDRERQVVRIPIERSMELLVERGWPGEEEESSGAEPAPRDATTP
ncbi:MAG: hypothetical protein WD403_16220 [Pirellulales bacterium]